MILYPIAIIDEHQRRRSLLHAALRNHPALQVSVFEDPQQFIHSSLPSVRCILLSITYIGHIEEILERFPDMYIIGLAMRQKMPEPISMVMENAQPMLTSYRPTTQAMEALDAATLITNEEWKEFKRVFERVYSGFFARLRNRYPQLTPAETRLLALIRAGFSNQEMADKLAISPSSVKRTATRLRRKLKLLPAASLRQLTLSI